MTITGAVPPAGGGGMTRLLDAGGGVVLRAGWVVLRRVEGAGVLGTGELLDGSGDELVSCGDVCGGVGDPDVLHADTVSSAVAKTATLRRRFTGTR